MKLSLKTTLSALAIGVAMAWSPLAAQAQSEQAPAAGSCAKGTPDCNGGGAMNKTTPQGATGKSDRAPEGAAKGATEGQQQKPTGKTAQQPTDNNNVAQEPKQSDQQNNTATEKGADQTKQAGEQDKTEPATQDQTAEQPKDKSGQQPDQGQAQDQSKPDNGNTASINNVTVEQKTEITNVIREEKVEPVSRLDFSVSVGVVVPHHVHLHRLPARIVKIVPAYESYEYFVLADGRIVIVDPDDLKIIAILTV
ncbi:MAG: DUF1236 domain-containing protein [Mesorhizobium sp.]